MLHLSKVLRIILIDIAINFEDKIPSDVRVSSKFISYYMR